MKIGQTGGNGTLAVIWAIERRGLNQPYVIEKAGHSRQWSPSRFVRVGVSGDLYSVLSACMGSMLAARVAGINPATAAASDRTPTAIAMLNGS